ncbi:MAG: PIN domain-containing protein [Neorhizobium sp.]|nr:PIN domain-containing protein [Neorhizobium sp.]
MTAPLPAVYVDTNIFIYLIDGTPSFRQRAKDELATIQQVGSLVSSEITLGECLRGALQMTNMESAATYTQMLENAQVITLVPVTLSLIKRAAVLGAELNLKLVDAIHVATAEASGCAEFLTNDRRIRTPTPIAIRPFGP